jgi:hypothetical protein
MPSQSLRLGPLAIIGFLEGGMKGKLTALVSGMLLVGAVSAAELPEIMTSATYVPMSDNEMANVQGTGAIANAFANAYARGKHFAAANTYTDTVAISKGYFNLAKSTSASSSVAF